MREIKFRAWATVTMYSNEELKLNGFSPIETISLNGKPLIFQQYTGLKDKNGVE
ncbi:MAG: hypothetical protein HKN40_12635, partial [Winogradskyella sp.]|nr:hypothetical protein [Winogradskyella sp.]